MTSIRETTEDEKAKFAAMIEAATPLLTDIGDADLIATAVGALRELTRRHGADSMAAWLYHWADRLALFTRKTVGRA